MIISGIKVENFRSLKNVSLDCERLTAILGRNGSGKSTILKALDVFYNVSYVATEFDFFAKDTKLQISIQVTYASLRDDEMEEFKPYLSNSSLTVTKVITSGGIRYLGVKQQLPDFVAIRQLPAVPKRTAWNALIDAGTYSDLGKKATKESEVDEWMAAFEAKNPSLLKPYPLETQFFGTKNVGAGKLDNYTKFVLIPAVRDASSETERRGVILQLIDVLVARSIDARPDVQKLNAEFTERVKSVYSRDNLTELSDLAKIITELLVQYAPGASLDLEFGDVTAPKIALPSALASLVEDNFKAPIGYTGHGLQRALILALLQKLSLTNVAPTTPSLAKEAADSGPPKQERIPDLILGIEEPELYLHPSRSRFLSAVFSRLTTSPEDEIDPSTQILFGTHSPYFIEMGRFEQIRLARKIPTEGYEPLQSVLTAFSRNQACHELAALTEKPAAAFTSASFVAHTVPVMTSIVNEGFFGDVVVIVEGFTELGSFWALQQIMKKSWDAKGVVVVPVEGKSKLDRPSIIFRGFGIPTYLVFDGDSRHKGTKDEASTAKLNRHCLKLIGAPMSDFPSTQANQHWAVLENDIETEISAAVGKEFYEAERLGVTDAFGYSKPTEAIKNPEVASALIQKIYSKGRTVPFLEEVVERITNLCGK